MGLVAVAAVVLAALAVPRAARVTGPWLALAMVITGVVLTSVVGVSSTEITVLGVAIVLFVISRWREGRTAAVWGLPPLFLLWANMDAGFAAGLLILVAALLLLQPGRRRRAAAQLAIALASALSRRSRTPLGPGIYALGDRRGRRARGRPEPHRVGSPELPRVVGPHSSKREIVLMIVLWTVSGGPDRFSAIAGFGHC